MFVRAGGLAARKRPELFEADRFLPLGDEVGVDEILMAELVPRVLVHIRRHVFIESKQSLLKGRVAEGQFVVLLPEVGFEDFGRRQKAKDSHVATRKTAAATALICLAVGFTGQPSRGWKQCG